MQENERTDLSVCLQLSLSISSFGALCYVDDCYVTIAIGKRLCPQSIP